MVESYVDGGRSGPARLDWRVRPEGDSWRIVDLVVGASGLIGGEVVGLLKARGHYVRTRSRDPGRAAKLKAMADDVRLGDATLPGTLDGVCAGIECVVSALGALVSPSAKGTRSFADVDLAANLALLAEAKRAGVRRYIYVGVHTGLLTGEWASS